MIVKRILLAACCGIVLTGSALAFGPIPLDKSGLVERVAIQGPVDEKYRIPVPTQQGKIEAGAEKAFADGKVTVKVTAIEQGTIEVVVNGGDPTPVKASELTLFEISDAEICTVVFLGKSGKKAIVAARCDPATDELKAAAAEQAAHRGDVVKSPREIIEAAAKGTLVNPFEGDANAITEGHQLFLNNSCNGCHGGNGGGGMCPPLTNEVWVYGSDPDTLFRLIAKGTDDLQADGYARKGRENVVGPMPPYVDIIENGDDLWKIVAFIQSLHKK
ncbi:c-type cytochrome [Chthonobacter albigriseus]|uniref:c-type cytochrome n=1 Tax=Chthonobacter albigriseus TaxID=1683161 RepID=UPI0015EEE714|nr:c-type cytochrome [Chthonobacter albigriseus]